MAAALPQMPPETIRQRHGKHAAHDVLQWTETADYGRDLASKTGGELKLTKNLKRIIATSFLQERIPIKSLAELYGFSIGQIENVIRGAIPDQRDRAEFAERELRQARDENARLINQETKS